MKAVLFNATMPVRPKGRTQARRSVNTEARISERNIALLKLSRNKTCAASIRSDAKRLSSSCRSAPLVNARGWMP
jgi:hypothetical protein